MQNQLRYPPKLPDFAFFCLSLAAFSLRPAKGRLSSQPNSTAAAFAVGKSPPSSGESSPTSTSESSACIGWMYLSLQSTAPAATEAMNRSHFRCNDSQPFGGNLRTRHANTSRPFLALLMSVMPARQNALLANAQCPALCVSEQFGKTGLTCLSPGHPVVWCMLVRTNVI